VFEPFYTTKASGIGLGLAIARKILEQHSGTIRVKSQEGTGSCFEILLPCEDEL
jgi:signal transduction histidine kinase